MKRTIYLFGLLIFLCVQSVATAQEATPAPTERTLHITIRTNGYPIPDHGVQGHFPAPVGIVTCTTDARGKCSLSFASNKDLIRGQLLVVGAGWRSVIWRGAELDLEIELENGQIDIPRDFGVSETAEPTNTPEPTIAPAATVLVVTPVAELLPTAVTTEIATTDTATTDEATPEVADVMTGPAPGTADSVTSDSATPNEPATTESAERSPALIILSVLAAFLLIGVGGYFMYQRSATR